MCSISPTLLLEFLPFSWSCSVSSLFRAEKIGAVSRPLCCESFFSFLILVLFLHYSGQKIFVQRLPHVVVKVSSVFFVKFISSIVFIFPDNYSCRIDLATNLILSKFHLFHSKKVFHLLDFYTNKKVL